MIIVELFIVMFVCTGIALLSMMTRDKYDRPKPKCPAYLCDKPAQLWSDFEKHLYHAEQMEGGHS
mgnify:CR=1 FL=1